MQTVQISGLHCEACVKLLTKRLSKINGVVSVSPRSSVGEFTVVATSPITAESINQILAGSEYSLESVQ